MDGSHKHFGQARQLAKCLAHPSNNSLLELGGRLLGKGESDNIARSKPRPVALSRCTTRCATTSVFPEPAHAISWRLANPNSMAFFCNSVNFIDVPRSYSAWASFCKCTIIEAIILRRPEELPYSFGP